MNSYKKYAKHHVFLGVFIPILPSGILDFVSSPVPFIAGIVVNSKEKIVKIIRDTRVKHALKDGLSLLNLSSGRLEMTKEHEIENIVSNCLSTM